MTNPQMTSPETTASAPESRDILIIGGGIAGCALALFLAKAGLPARVFEAYPDVRGIGGGLQIAPNGLAVLDQLGLADALAARGTACERSSFRDRHGRSLGGMANRRPGSPGRPAVMLARATLQELLHDTGIARGVRIEHGKRLAGFEDDGDGVTARFEDGTTARGALLVGADGLHSRVRRILLPDGPEPTYTGLTGTGGWTPRAAFAKAGLTDPGAMTLFFGAGAFIGCTLAERDEASGGMWWTSLARDRPLDARNRGEAAESIGLDQIIAAGDGWNPMVRQILGATTEMIAPVDIFDIASLPRWCQGRAVLVGDAAHAVAPHSGQGASMALEDAITLARLLRDGRPAEWPGRLAAFEHERRDRVERIVAFSRKIGALKRRGPFGTWLQNNLMRLFLSLRAPDFSWVQDHRIVW
ncbi:MAG: FAD-dependent monooxygenase [Rhizobiales bacterium]|nr:FAD-dependent monooxygenase [Hyphomicrobiales bacterium]